MNDTKHSSRLRVAIIGGGIAGPTLIHVLLKYSHIDVKIYESGPEFSERGAAIGLSSKYQAALKEMDPGLMDIVDAAGATCMASTRLMIGSGPHAGEILMDMTSHIKEEQNASVHRAALLNGLLAPIPREIMHANKKVTQVDDTAGNERVVLHFQDGTVEYADAVIGADGIHGYTRKHILGDDPSVNASFAGYWDYRFLVPIERAREALSKELFTETRQYGWCGEGGFFMHDVLNNGESVQCVSSAMASTWGTDEWKKDLDRKTLEDSFAGWTNSPIAPGMIKLLLENPDLRAYPQWHHNVHAPTFAKNRVCMIGDAAHAMTPWQGSGAGQAIEDVMILDALFSRIEDNTEIAAAFKAYDAVRRPRSQKVVDSSAGTAKILCGKEPDIGLDPDKIREATGPRWGFIFALDYKEHKKDALSRFDSLKS